MAKTNGHTNPPWNRDETILALELFIDAGMVALPATETRVVELSNLLRAMPFNKENSRKPSFRNPAGVSFKLSNLQSVAGGKGFANASRNDHAVWAYFQNRHQALRRVATQIKRFANEVAVSVSLSDDEEFPEGAVLTAAHKKIERNQKLRMTLIRERMKNAPLKCDACSTSKVTTDPHLNEAIFEAHHLTPLASIGATTTKLSEMALLCATCHRLIHRLSKKQGSWASITDLKTIITAIDR